MRMMNSLVVLSLAACLAWLVPGSCKAAEAGAADSPTFEVGDVPPRLAPMAWIKGEPVTAFEQGHVYVVEFFTTWCGASRQSMPLLSELAARHGGKLTVIGVNVRESEHGEASVAAVTRFVQGRKDMDFIVAMDDPVDTPMFTSWMRAAGMYATPTAFIIGRDGRLTYVGIPIDPEASYGFELAVEQALAGTSDLDAARQLQSEVGEQIKRYLADMELMKTLDEAIAREDYRAVLAEADRLVAQDPELEDRLFASRLSAMLYLEEAKALAFARNALATVENAEMSVVLAGTVGSMIAYRPGLSRDAYELAVASLESAAARRDSDEYNEMLDVLALARAQHRLGEEELAIALQQRGMDIARDRNDVSGDMMAIMEEALAEYRMEEPDRSR